MNLGHLFAVMNARIREFVRDVGGLAWNFLFPVLIIVGFWFAFSGRDQTLFKVGVIHPFGTETAAIKTELETLGATYSFFKTKHLEWVPIQPQDQERALKKLKNHHYDLIVAPATKGYWINSSSPKGELVESLLMQNPIFQRQTVDGVEIRYVDWLISGLLAMNMMFSALFGIGYVIVRYRKKKVLKRLRATPLRAFEFLLAQVLSRLILLVGVTAIVYFGTHALIHYQMLGSYFDLLIVMILGSMCLISLGLLVAARFSNEEWANGLLNLFTWPMMFFSGVWFSLEGTSPWIQRIAQFFPLTHVIDASRAIMTEGATLSQVSGNLAILSIMTAVFLGASAWLFRWE